MPFRCFRNGNDIEFTCELTPIDSKMLSTLFGVEPKKSEKTRAPSISAEGITVLFNDPATILWKDGKKYVSKAHNEEFDEEKGLLMCLAKANGISHSDLQRMLASAKRQIKKDKAEKVEEKA